MKDLDKICRLVGNTSAEQLVYVDYAVTDSVGVFMPIAGQCKYALQPEHTHPSWSFIVSFDSNCITRISGKTVRSIPSTIFIHPPDIPHQELPSSSVARYIAVMIAPDFFAHHLSIYRCESDSFSKESTCPTNQRIIDTLKDFLTEYESDAPGAGQVLDACGITITHLIIRQFLNLSQPNGSAHHRMSVNRAIEYCNDHYSEKISVKDLAVVAHCSVSHFSRIFKTETSLSPADYLMNIRLNCAKRMLRAHEKSITEIALDCGFGSSSYFSHCFTRAFNAAPSDFRNLFITSDHQLP